MVNLSPTVSTPQRSNLSYNLKDWQGGYESLRQESAYWIDEVEGEVPTQLEGTFFRNGPGLFDIGGQSIKHPFDGDGMVCAFSFRGGRVHFQNRFVRTEGFLKEQAAGKILYRGVFGTQKPGGWLANLLDMQFKNIANTNVLYWGGKLLALWEGAEPHRLDPKNLETVGLDYLGGMLKPGQAFAAHPRLDPASIWDGGEPCLVNFSTEVGASTQIRVYEFSLEGKLRRQQVHSVPGFAFIHDFALTPHYYIFFQNPVKFNPLPYLLGLRGAGECMDLQTEQPTRIIVIPRDVNASQGVQILESPAGFIFHHANAFEVDERKIAVDSVCYASYVKLKNEVDFREVDFEALEPGLLWRFHLDLDQQTVKRECWGERCCEFPVVHPEKVGRNARYVYLGAGHATGGNAPLQAVVKMDLWEKRSDCYSFAPRGYVGEPIFVPKPEGEAEDEGWLLVLVYDASHHRSKLVILDAQDLAQGAIATLHLKHHIPYGLHGTWTPEYFLD
ncbi:carotenoid oxygenase family protein [Spirulina subsalsa FACHB-351]|uniref:Carotenoid oxygenase family protein n=1 Tax=Spirulina subsalsa FACHB-351 TaxID=234711 RepID=A0ABT3L0K2_9CYAN|nr:carotenoid oxygenase family protein [Spirulina subsalsa]MCW6035024.1 carotenoid oxygenase family protein [Spirulina subsalsa FACHB-351]